jgi:hypothetical protein
VFFANLRFRAGSRRAGFREREFRALGVKRASAELDTPEPVG